MIHTRGPEGILNMIDLKELLKGKEFSSLPKEHQDNLMLLLERVNRVRITWGKGGA